MLTANGALKASVVINAPTAAATLSTDESEEQKGQQRRWASVRDVISLLWLPPGDASTTTPRSISLASLWKPVAAPGPGAKCDGRPAPQEFNLLKPPTSASNSANGDLNSKSSPSDTSDQNYLLLEHNLMMASVPPSQLGLDCFVEAEVAGESTVEQQQPEAKSVDDAGSRVGSEEVARQQKPSRRLLVRATELGIDLPRLLASTALLVPRRNAVQKSSPGSRHAASSSPGGSTRIPQGEGDEEEEEEEEEESGDGAVAAVSSTTSLTRGRGANAAAAEASESGGMAAVATAPPAASGAETPRPVAGASWPRVAAAATAESDAANTSGVQFVTLSATAQHLARLSELVLSGGGTAASPSGTAALVTAASAATRKLPIFRVVLPASSLLLPLPGTTTSECAKPLNAKDLPQILRERVWPSTHYICAEICAPADGTESVVRQTPQGSSPTSQTSGGNATPTATAAATIALKFLMFPTAAQDELEAMKERLLQALNKTFSLVEAAEQIQERRGRRMKLLEEGGPQVEFFVHDSLVGMVIGKQGENLSRVARAYGVSIRVFPEENGLRRVRIYGIDPQRLERAKTELDYIYLELELPTARNRLLTGGPHQANNTDNPAQPTADHFLEWLVREASPGSLSTGNGTPLSNKFSSPLKEIFKSTHSIWIKDESTLVVCGLRSVVSDVIGKLSQAYRNSVLGSGPANVLPEPARALAAAASSQHGGGSSMHHNGHTAGGHQNHHHRNHHHNNNQHQQSNHHQKLVSEGLPPEYRGSGNGPQQWEYVSGPGTAANGSSNSSSQYGRTSSAARGGGGHPQDYSPRGEAGGMRFGVREAAGRDFAPPEYASAPGPAAMYYGREGAAAVFDESMTMPPPPPPPQSSFVLPPQVEAALAGGGGAAGGAYSVPGSIAMPPLSEYNFYPRGSHYPAPPAGAYVSNPPGYYTYTEQPPPLWQTAGEYYNDAQRQQVAPAAPVILPPAPADSTSAGASQKGGGAPRWNRKSRGAPSSGGGYRNWRRGGGYGNAGGNGSASPNRVRS